MYLRRCLWSVILPGTAYFVSQRHGYQIQSSTMKFSLQTVQSTIKTETPMVVVFIYQTRHTSRETYWILFLTSENILISDLSINRPGPPINSDHFIISFNLNYYLPRPIMNKVRYVLDYSKADWDGLCMYLIFNVCFQSTDNEFIWSKVKSVVYEAMCKNIP